MYVVKENAQKILKHTLGYKSDWFNNFEFLLNYLSFPSLISLLHLHSYLYYMESELILQNS
jgi:hypothetical protein